MPESQEKQWVSSGDRDRVHKMSMSICGDYDMSGVNGRILPSQVTVCEIYTSQVDGCGNYGL